MSYAVRLPALRARGEDAAAVIAGKSGETQRRSSRFTCGEIDLEVEEHRCPPAR